MARRDKYSQESLDNIVKCQAKKTARRKRKKRANALKRSTEERH